MKYNCLIVDDEKLLADSTAEYINLFGVKAAVAPDASACREFFRENTAELLLLLWSPALGLLFLPLWLPVCCL